MASLAAAAAAAAATSTPSTSPATTYSFISLARLNHKTPSSPSFPTLISYASLLKYRRRRFGSITTPVVKATTSKTVFSTSEGVKPAISLTENALKHLNKMRSEKNEDLYLRIGVKQGGCSGMSYLMEFEDSVNAKPDDSIMDYEGFTIVCDPKSLLFLYGMQLDFSDALIGGGFSFKNPNATQTCGCGKSFAADA